MAGRLLSNFYLALEAAGLPGENVDDVGSLAAGTVARAGIKTRKEMMVNSAPLASVSAPVTTCAVATSAALFDQMVTAPRATCTRTNPTHANESFDNGWSAPKLRRVARAQKITRQKITNATKRCASCRTI